MIHFLHGDNQVASRQKLTSLISQAKDNNQEIIQLDGLKIDLNQLIQALEASSLFGQEKLVIIESLFSRQKGQEKENIIQYLKKETIIPELIFWEKKEIPGTTTRWFPKDWQYQVFKTPVAIFKFLDSIKPQNQKQMFTLLLDSIRVNSVEMVFYMLARRIHDLIIAKDLGKSGLKGAPWQIGKLVSQAQNFTLNQLIQLYQKLLSIDRDIKTGQSLMPLDWHLDLLIVNM
jgi:DNA polymerase III delta subunit